MIKMALSLSVWISALFIALPAQAAKVEIEWQSPEKYRDIRAGTEEQKAFQERVISALSEHFETVAEQRLPPDQTLILTITDVDLAGDVEYFFLRFPTGVRVMRDIYFPSITFDYELRDKDSKVIESGKENMKDMGYLYSGFTFIKDPPLNYEKRMIDDWFRKKFR